jgi:hypothetical protein
MHLLDGVDILELLAVEVVVGMHDLPQVVVVVGTVLEIEVLALVQMEKFERVSFVARYNLVENFADMQH